MTPHTLITAGNALACFARDIAVESVRASGDVMDGAHAEALAHALGRMQGQQAGTALRDELLHLARCLRSGFGAALAQITDPDTLTDEEEESLGAAHIHIAAANGACARLLQLEEEIAGQATLPL